MQKSFFKFLVIGSIGFIIDSGISLGLIHIGVNPAAARPPAIFLAMSFTWLLNRRHTYKVKSAASLQEAVRYFVVAIISAILNFSIYYFLIINNSFPLIAIGISTIIVAIFSYFAYKKIVFKIGAR